MVALAIGRFVPWREARSTGNAVGRRSPVSPPPCRKRTSESTEATRERRSLPGESERKTVTLGGGRFGPPPPPPSPPPPLPHAAPETRRREETKRRARSMAGAAGVGRGARAGDLV